MAGPSLQREKVKPEWMSEKIKVAVVGANGRMGREALKALSPSHGFQIVAAVDRAENGKSVHDLVGGDSPKNVFLTDKLGAALDAAPTDVVLDFSHHSAVVAHTDSAFTRGANIVIGCTGISEANLSEIRSLAKEYGRAAMYIPNFAIGAVLMMKFSQLAAKWMPDAEIIEMHHERKEDSPSGTALLTAEIISQARVRPTTKMPSQLIKVEGARGGKFCDIPVHSIRLPGFLAHQQVIFGGPGETLTIRHDSTDRASFMHGVRLALHEVANLQGLTIGLDKLLFKYS
jgi:4-hydroxy-tetrahydrodipicolinate reductase